MPLLRESGGWRRSGRSVSGVRLGNQGQVASQRDHNVKMRRWNLDDALVLNMKWFCFVKKRGLGLER